MVCAALDICWFQLELSCKLDQAADTLHQCILTYSVYTYLQYKHMQVGTNGFLMIMKWARLQHGQVPQQPASPQIWCDACGPATLDRACWTPLPSKSGRLLCRRALMVPHYATVLMRQEVCCL